MADVFNRAGKGIAKDFTGTLAGIISNNPSMGIGETIVARVGSIYRKKTNSGSDSANWNSLDFDPENLSYASVSAMKNAEDEILSIRDKIFIEGSSQGGQFYYDPDDTTTTEDGGIVFVTPGGKRIKRITDKSTVDLSWFCVLDGTTDDSTAFLAAQAVASAQGKNLELSKGICAIQSLTISIEIIFSGGKLKALSATNNNIVLNAKFSSTHLYKIFDGTNLLPAHPTNGLDGSLAFRTDLANYPIQNNSLMTFYPEWYGAVALNSVDYAAVSVSADKYNTDAFYAMHKFACASNTGLHLKYVFKENGVYWTQYSKLFSALTKLKVEGNNCSLGNKANWITGLDIGFSVRGSTFLPSPTVVSSKYFVTGLDGGNIPEGATRVKLVDDTYISDYSVGDWVFIGSWMMYTGGWPPSHKYYSYHKIVDIDDDTDIITLDTPIKDTHYLIAPEYRFSGNLIGKPALYPKTGRVYEELEINNVTILSNPVKANASVWQTRFNIADIITFSANNLKFRPYDGQALNHLYYYPSNGREFHHTGIESTDGQYINFEVDKNIGLLTINNSKNIELSGMTGLRDFEANYSSFKRVLIGGRKFKMLNCNFEKAQKPLTTALTKYLEIDKVLEIPFASNSGSAASNTEITFPSLNELQFNGTISNNLNKMSKIEPGTRFMLRKTIAQGLDLSGVFGVVNSLKSYVYDPDVNINNFTAIFDVTLQYVSNPNYTPASPPTSSDYDFLTIHPIEKCFINDTEYLSQNYINEEVLPNLNFVGLNATKDSRIAHVWDGKTLKFKYKPRTKAGYQASDTFDYIYWPIGGIVPKSIKVNVVKPYTGNAALPGGGTFTTMHLLFGAGTTRIGFQSTATWQIDLMDRGTTIISPTEVSKKTLDANISLENVYTFGGHLRTYINGSPISISSVNALVPDDWEANRPVVEIEIEVDEVFDYLKTNTPKPKQYFLSAPPTIGANKVGDSVINSSPISDAPLAWRCITAGTPGTWQPINSNYSPHTFQFEIDGAKSIRITEAMTLDCSQPSGSVYALGGTFTIRKALSASATSYSTVTSSVESFAAGDYLRIELFGATFNPGVAGEDIAMITINRSL